MKTTIKNKPSFSMKDGLFIFLVYYFLPPFKSVNNGKQIFFNIIPISVPIIIVINGGRTNCTKQPSP